jgi:hypothetical protein
MVKRIALLVVAFACVIGLGYAATLAGHSDDRDGNDTLQITIRDFCDKNTFPAGLCTGNGKITFAAFNAELAAFKDAGSWKFVPDVAATEEGVNLTLTNVGGETHTFTRVAKFGGGFVAGLNIASGNPVPHRNARERLMDAWFRSRPAPTTCSSTLGRPCRVRASSRTKKPGSSAASTHGCAPPSTPKNTNTSASRTKGSPKFIEISRSERQFRDRSGCGRPYLTQREKHP